MFSDCGNDPVSLVEKRRQGASIVPKILFGGFGR